TDGLTRRPEEGDHVVVGLALDLLHPLQVATRLADLRHRLRGHHPALGPGLADRDLDPQPEVDLVPLAPDAAHLRPGVSLDPAVPPSIGSTTPPGAAGPTAPRPHAE